MESQSLVLICISAFSAVFLVLILLSIFMRLIITFSPPEETGDDAPVMAALAATINSVYPGTQITKIEELK